jgi:hypothetical protein
VQAPHCMDGQCAQCANDSDCPASLPKCADGTCAAR